MLFPISTIQILIAVAVFLRVLGIVSLLPLFGEGGVPVRVRILLSVALSVTVLPIVPETFAQTINQQTGNLFSFSLLVLREGLIGVVIGYIAKLTFDGIVMASNIVGVQMGFSTSNIFLPDSDASTNGFSALHRILVVLIFLSLNLHYVYVGAIVESFNRLPLGSAWSSGPLTELMVKVSGTVFSTAIQLAAPTLVGLLFATAALGLISRAVPQANIFVLSFPVSFFTGLLVYMAMLPMLPGWLGAYFAESNEQILNSILAMKR